MLDILAKANVKAVWFSFGETLGRWIERFRTKDCEPSADGTRTLVFVLVNSVEEALKAVNEWNADVVVAQGSLSISHRKSLA